VCVLCSTILPRPLPSIDAAVIDSFKPPAAQRALAVQLVCVAASICPYVEPKVAPSTAALGSCFLASIGAVFALSYTAATRDAGDAAQRSQLSLDLSSLASALFTPSDNSSNDICSHAITSQCVSAMLQRCHEWARVLEQTLHLNAVIAIQELVAQVHHSHMSACVDAILPVICDICGHFDVAHRGTGARALLHVMSHANKVVLRQHKDCILKVRCAFKRYSF
jgi:hypothetical protein